MIQRLKHSFKCQTFECLLPCEKKDTALKFRQDMARRFTYLLNRNIIFESSNMFSFYPRCSLQLRFSGTFTKNFANTKRPEIVFTSKSGPMESRSAKNRGQKISRYRSFKKEPLLPPSSNRVSTEVQNPHNSIFSTLACK